MATMFRIKLVINGKEKVIVNSTEKRFNHNLQVAKTKGYQIISKEKLYPVAKWLTHQHVFYNASDRAVNALHDAEQSGKGIDKAIEWKEKVDDILAKFDYGPQDGNGIVYMSWNDYKVAKDIIGGYAYRHNGMI